jgi:hypothetical protein
MSPVSGIHGFFTRCLICLSFKGLEGIVASRIETGQLADVRLGAPHRIGSIGGVADRDVTLDNNTQQKG